MTMKDFLIEKYGIKPESEDLPDSNNAEFQEYLAIEPKNPDLSGVDFVDRVVIYGNKFISFESFTADSCGFKGGFTMARCRIAGCLSFYFAYVYDSFELLSVRVGGSLTYPQNIGEMFADEDPGPLKIADLTVKGPTLFTKP